MLAPPVSFNGNNLGDGCHANPLTVHDRCSSAWLSSAWSLLPQLAIPCILHAACCKYWSTMASVLLIMDAAQNTIPGGGQVESVLTAQMGQLQISGTGYSHQHPAQFHIPPSQYGGGGWALSHATPSGLPHGQVTHTHIHTHKDVCSHMQEHSTEHHSSGEMKSHHIQVISSGNSEHASHNDDSAHGPKAPVHMYYPNTV